MPIQIWGDLGRAINDDTRIDEAIGQAIDAHLADPDAHLDETGSLQSHRASEIIDHLAESVVNDKIKWNARAYAAIVDASSEYDFGTIEAAIDYVKTLDGGSILIMPGTYYLSTVIEIPVTINLIGLDPDVTTIVTDGDTDKYFIATASSTQQTDTMFVENLTFETISEYAFNGYATEDYLYGTMYFNNCVFKGVGGYYYYGLGGGVFDSCVFYLGTIGALTNWQDVVVLNCRFTTELTSGTAIFCDSSADEQMEFVRLDNCNTWGVVSVSVIWFKGYGFGNCSITNCTFVGWTTEPLHMSQSNIVGNTFYIKSSNYIVMDRSHNRFIGNFLSGGTGNKLRLTSEADRNIVGLNEIGTSVTNSGTNNVITDNITS